MSGVKASISASPAKVTLNEIFRLIYQHPEVSESVIHTEALFT